MQCQTLLISLADLTEPVRMPSYQGYKRVVDYTTVEVDLTIRQAVPGVR